ncbi:uncharacterized protein LOC126894848 [Daktulosphaira vitifoliae]|uniref:uncharacterized protein LOC126894848 n=1 Tax=Daktulosphaira vitifoliae TaxID=58002 RepID=UPI0021A9AF33|nr:uncharacterized protein LOC126894848 [Daktulosphaira vitifoliae]
MTWCVVNFMDDNSVEVVPDFWFNHKTGMCAWPTNHLNNSRFNEKRRIPNRKKFKYLSQGFLLVNFLVARKKCRLAEDTSDLDGLSSKRKKVNKKFNSKRSKRFTPNSSPEPADLKIESDCLLFSSESDDANSPNKHNFSSPSKRLVTPKISSTLYSTKSKNMSIT